MGLSVSDKLAFIREYKKQGGKGNYLSAIKQYQDGGETTNETNPNNVNINYKPVTGEFIIPTKEKELYIPVRDNTNKPQMDNPVERQIRQEKLDKIERSGDVRPLPDESFTEKIYREVVPEYIQNNIRRGAEDINKVNDRMVQPAMALATLPMAAGIAKNALYAIKAKRMYDAAALVNDAAGMSKWSQLGNTAANSGANVSRTLAQLEKSRLNNASDFLQLDYLNMLQRPLLKTAVKYGLNGNKLSAAYATVSGANAVRNINQSLNE